MRLNISWNGGPNNPAEELEWKINHGHYIHLRDEARGKKAIATVRSRLPEKKTYGYIDNRYFYAAVFSSNDETINLSLKERNVKEIELAFDDALHMQIYADYETIMKFTEADKFAFLYLNMFIDMIDRNHNCSLRLSEKQTSFVLKKIAVFFGLKQTDCWNRLISDLPDRIYVVDVDNGLFNAVSKFSYNKKKDVLSVCFSEHQYIHRYAKFSDPLFR